jgi:hypothetical protein
MHTPIATCTKLSKQDEGTTIDYTLYKRLVGSLMYLTTTRPNIMYAVNLISRFMENHKISHWKVGKRILRYIAGTTNMEFGIPIQKMSHLSKLREMLNGVISPTFLISLIVDSHHKCTR